MFFSATDKDKNLEAALAECKEQDIDTQLILFITADDIGCVSEKITSVFPDIVVMGIQSFMFRNGQVQKDGTVIIMLEKEPSEFEYSYGIIENVTTDPAKDILSIQKKVASIHPGDRDTICLEFCTGGEERLLTTLNSVMKEHGITVFGSTTDLYGSTTTSTIFYDCHLYKDACIYIIIRNLYGRIVTWSQNIYKHHDDGILHMATKVDKKRRILIELDGRPAAEVYCKELGISISEISNAYPYHPFSKNIGTEDYLVSIKDCNPDGSLSLCKQINQNDLLFISDLDDYKSIIKQDFERIHEEIPYASSVFTIDCIFRYLLFESEGCLDWYAKSLYDIGASSLGLMGMGEQYDVQNSNQTMICAVFERLDFKPNVLCKDASGTDNIDGNISTVRELSSKIRLVENKQLNENLNARIYPLDFMLHYVNKAKDNIVQRETFIMENLLLIQRQLQQILTKNDPKEIHDYAESILDGSHDMADRLSSINLQIEDMSNMLDQTEYLINDVVYIDGLTGLLNRAFYNMMSDDLFEKSQKKDGMSIAFFDIDDFKHFNTDFGHDFGDEVLKQLAMELKNCFRLDDELHLIRMGGDEFMILNPSILPYEDFVERMDQVRKCISEHRVRFNNMEDGLTISIGMANAKSEQITSMWNLYRSADSRLYEAKNAGKNQIRAYSHE